MEFKKEVLTELKKLIRIWLSNSTFELECGYSSRENKLSITTFQGIAQYLKNKGFDHSEPKEYLNIITPECRYTIHNTVAIEDYCNKETLEDIDYTCMTKTRSPPSDGGEEAPDIQLNEYNLRVRLRNEIKIDKTDPNVQQNLKFWNKISKTFRLIKRWSYIYNNLQFDLSIVRMNPPNKRFITFKDANILNQPPQYEVEIEMIHTNFDQSSSVDIVLKELVNGMGTILKGIQQNGQIIKNSVIKQVLLDYTELIKPNLHVEFDGKTAKTMFRGCAPVTLEIKNMQKDILKEIPNIREDYFVTDKADGLRVHCYIDPTGHLYLIDMNLKVYKTGLFTANKTCFNTLLDGEWITVDKHKNPINQCLIFDIYYYNGIDVAKLPFFKDPRPGATSAPSPASTISIPDIDNPTRFTCIKKWFELWNESYEPKTATGIVQILSKSFKRCIGDDIFNGCAEFLSNETIYNTDGLIITSNTEPLPHFANKTFNKQFKWKPAKDNTVDFLVLIDKDDETGQDKIYFGKPSDISTRYKIMKLYVGSTVLPIYNNPRNTILNNNTDNFQNIINQAKFKGGKQSYIPVLFNPENYSDPYSAICYSKIKQDPKTDSIYIATDEEEGTGEPIMNEYIVEMRYDSARDNGWRWIPIRVRHDKTERYRQQLSGRTMNADKVAESVWESIHNPVTKHMITSGDDAPSKEEYAELKGIQQTYAEHNEKYYESHNKNVSVVNLVSNMRNFHNEYIKKDILYSKIFKTKRVAPPTTTNVINYETKTLIDYSCGKAGDIHKWNNFDLDFVLGIDISSDNINNKKNGAYRRYLNIIVENSERGSRKPRRGYRSEENTDKSLPVIVFVIGDSTKSIVNGNAGETPEDKNILKYLFGDKSEPVLNSIPPYLKNITHSPFEKQKANAGVSMFSLHYFFKDKETLDGLIQNIDNTIENNGYFAGCCFDGDEIFKLLNDIAENDSASEMNGTEIIWSIRKKYNNSEFGNSDDSLGLNIGVNFTSIGKEHDEYLVNFHYFTKLMSEKGFDLVETKLFSESYNEIIKNDFYKRKYMMEDNLKKFSFLNRWFIYKKNIKIDLSLPLPSSAPAPAGAGAGAPFVDPTTAPPPSTDDINVPPPTGDFADKFDLKLEEKIPIYEQTSISSSTLLEVIGPNADIRKDITDETCKTILPKSFKIYKTVAGKGLPLYTFNEYCKYYRRYISPFVQTNTNNIYTLKMLKTGKGKTEYENVSFASIEHYLRALRIIKYSNKTNSKSIHDYVKKRFGMNGYTSDKIIEYAKVKPIDITKIKDDLNILLDLNSIEYTILVNLTQESTIKESYKDFKYDYEAFYTDLDTILNEVISIRYKNDPMFASICTDLIIKQNKYILYKTNIKTEDNNMKLTGDYDTKTKEIIGSNLYGIALMKFIINKDKK